MTEEFSAKHFDKMKSAYRTEREDFAAMREALKETVAHPGTISNKDIAQDCAIIGVMDSAAASVNAKNGNALDAFSFLKEARDYIRKSHELGRAETDVDRLLSTVELDMDPKAKH